MKLMIVESPNKTAKIGAILGGDWKIAASVGHIRDLPPNETGVAAPDFRPNYVFTDRGGEVCQRLRGLAARAEEVFLATDPDREGEAIAWHLKEVLRLRNPRRVTFDAITPDVIRKALQKPRQIDINLVHAQEARRVLDRLVGYQVSPILKQQTGAKVTSAGRVQSPAVRLVVEREREIQVFRETKHFGAEVSFDLNKWRAQWQTKPFLKNDEEYILDEELAKRAAACRDFRVIDSGVKQASSAPPPPFTTSTMLQAASVTLHFDPKSTAALAQALFEQGLITYHRTDSPNFSDEAIAEIRNFAQANGWSLPPKARKWKSKESAQEAHEGIRPTHLDDRKAGETAEQQALYQLIWHRAVASQLADALYNVTFAELECSQGAETFVFVATGRKLTFPGWKVLTGKDAADEEDEDDEEGGDGGNVPLLRQDSSKYAEDGRVLYKKTKPPSRYTQASLIKKLEAIGIGRPSTYSNILQNIIGRNYLEERKRFLFPTDSGFLLVDSLTGKFGFIEYDFTKHLETGLDEIAEGDAQYLALVRHAYDQLAEEIGKLNLPPRPVGASSGGNSQAAGIAQCPACKKGTVREIHAGARTFWGCSKYQRDGSGCKFSIPGEWGQKSLSEMAIRQLCEKGQTSQTLKGFKSKEGKKFDAKLRLDEDFRLHYIFENRK